MTHHMIKRVAAVDATMARFKDKPLEYGKHDCVRVAAFCLRQQGLKISLLNAGLYSSARGALRVMRTLGYSNLGEAVDAIGLPRIAPAAALPGDIIALEGPEQSWALTVCIGNGRVMGFYGGADNTCIILQPHQYLAAWRSV